MSDNERELVLRITVDADDLAPEIARLRAELKSLEAQQTSGNKEAAKSSDQATEAVKRRRKANEDLDKTTSAQGETERKSLEKRLALLEKHSKALLEHAKAVEVYKRKLAEVDALNAVAESRFLAGQTRTREILPAPEAPVAPQAPPGLLTPTDPAKVSRKIRTKRPVDQTAVRAEAAVLADEIISTEIAVEQEVDRQVKAKRVRKPAASKAAKQVAEEPAAAPDPAPEPQESASARSARLLAERRERYNTARRAKRASEAADEQLAIEAGNRTPIGPPAAPTAISSSRYRIPATVGEPLTDAPDPDAPSAPSTPRRPRGKNSKVQVDVDCAHLHHSIDECLKRNRKHSARIGVDAKFLQDSIDDAVGKKRGAKAGTPSSGPVEGPETETQAARRETAQATAAAAKTRAAAAAAKAATDSEAATQKAATAAAKATADSEAATQKAATAAAKSAEDRQKAAREDAKAEETLGNLKATNAKKQKTADETLHREKLRNARIQQDAEQAAANAAQSRNSRIVSDLLKVAAAQRATRAADRADNLAAERIRRSQNEEARRARLEEERQERAANTTRSRRPTIRGALRQFKESGQSTGRSFFDEVKQTDDQAENPVRRIQRALGAVRRDNDGGAGLVSGTSKAVENLAEGVGRAFAPLGKHLLSARTLILAGVAALGPLVAGLGSLAAGALASANALVQLAGTSAALPGLFTAAATGVIALVVAIKPLANVLDLYGKAQEAAAEATATNSRAAGQNARDLAAANRAVGAAGRDLAKASRDEDRAQRGLTNARRDAKRSLEDLNLELSRANLNEQGAVLNVKQAKLAYEQSLVDSSATVLDQQQAYFNYLKSQEDLKDTQTKNDRLRDDINEKVKDASDRVQDASDRVTDAHDRAADAKDRQAKANEELTKSEGIAKYGSEAAYTAQLKLNAAIEKLGPSTRKVALGLAAAFIDESSPWKKVQKAVSESFFTPLVDKVDDVVRLLGPLSSMLNESAKALGDLTAKGVTMLTSGPWTSFFGDQAKANAKLLSSLGDAGLDVADAFRYIIEAARPFTQFVADGIKNLAADFRDWAKAGKESGSIADFLDRVQVTLGQVGAIVGNVFGALKSLFFGSTDFTGTFLEDLVKITDKFEAWAKEAEKPNSGFRKFLEDTLPLLRDLGTFLKDVVTSFFEMASDPRNIKEARDILRAFSEDILPAIVRLFSDLSKSGAISKIAEGIGAFANGIATLLENGGATAIGVFASGLQFLGESLEWAANLPGVATAISGLAIALAGLAAVSVVAKFSGLMAIMRAVGFVVGAAKSGAFLATLGAKILGRDDPAATDNERQNRKATKAGGPLGGAAGSGGVLQHLTRIETQIARMIVLLQTIAAKPGGSGGGSDYDPDGNPRNPRGGGSPGGARPQSSRPYSTGTPMGSTAGYTAAAEQLMVAARALQTAAARLGVAGGIPGRTPISSTPYRIPATTGAPLVAGAAATAAAGSAVARRSPGTIDGVVVPPGAAKPSVLGRLARGGGKAAAVALIAATLAPLFSGLFGSDDTDQQGGEGSFLDNAGGLGGLVMAGVSTALLGTGLMDGGGKDSDRPGFLKRLLSSRTPSTPGTALATRPGGTVATRGVPAAARTGARFLPRLLPRLAAGAANPFALAGTAVGIGADLAWQGEERKKPAGQLARAGGAVLTGAGIGATVGSVVPVLGTAVGAAVGAVAGGAYSLAKDKGLRDTVGKGIDKAWDGAFEGFMRAIGSPVAEFFRGVYDKVRDFFTKTLPKLPGQFVRNLRELPGALVRGFTFAAGRIYQVTINAFKRIQKWWNSWSFGELWDKFWDTFISPVADWFENLGDRVAEWWGSWTFSGVWKAIKRDFLNPVWNWLTGLPDRVTNWWNSWSFAGVWNSIRVGFLEPTWNWLTSLPDRVTTWWNSWSFAGIWNTFKVGFMDPIENWFKAIPNKLGEWWGGIKDFFSGNNRFTEGRDSAGGRQSGGLIEGTYDGRVDTKRAWLTVGEHVTRKRVVDKPMGKRLLEDLNQERIDPAAFYAALSTSTRLANMAVVMPTNPLSAVSAPVSAGTTTNHRGGLNTGDIHIHNPVREKSDRSMRRTLQTLAFMAER